MLRSDLATFGETVTAGVIPTSACSTPALSGSSSRVLLRCFLAFFLLSCALAASTPSLDRCVPIRWTGGPLEVAWRTRTKALPADATVRDSIARWYEPATLSLLESSAVNCLLVTWSGLADAAVEAEQQQLVKAYTDAAHKRGLAVLGLIYSAGDAPKIAADAVKASLDGLVLEGDFPAEFPAALKKAGGSIAVIEVAKDAASARWKTDSIIAVTGVMPSGRNLSEMGIRGSPSSQPWIESNVWLARSFPFGQPTRSLWISSRLEGPTTLDYQRAAADAAAAGGRWIVSLDDGLRAKLLAHDSSALETWQRLLGYLKFAESHAAWRELAPYGNVGIVLDPATTQPDVSDEYLKLAVRRQIPYRSIPRSELNAIQLARFRAIVATELNPLSAAEHKLLQDFAEAGGVVIAGPSWGNAPKSEPFTEFSMGKGSVFVYKDPDPESVAHDLKETLSDDDLGVVPFNVPSVITSTTGGRPGEPLLVQLVNYFDHPVEAITLRLAGRFHSARMETPDAPPMDLPVRNEEGKTEVTIPRLLLWSAVSMQ